MSVTFEEIIQASESEDNFLQLFQNGFSQRGESILEAHRVILSACYRNPGLAPTIKGKTPEALTQSWLKKYRDSYDSRISRRTSKTPGTIADPIINTILKSRLTGLTTDHLEQIKYAHRLSMSAENIQGLLLEEFLAEQLVDYGWYCGWGDVIRHVDFCNVDGSLLQIKNRSNSENSSSSRVRINQPIEKWHRVDAKTGRYHWSYFNQKYNTERFSEENFAVFVKRVLTINPDALAVEQDNSWKIIADVASSSSK